MSGAEADGVRTILKDNANADPVVGELAVSCRHVHGFAVPPADAGGAGSSVDRRLNQTRPTRSMLPSPLPAPASSEPATGAAASSDVGAVRSLLTRLTVALNRRRAYAATHPMVAQAEAALLSALGPITKARGSLTIGVAQPELLIDGVPLEGAGAIGRELAERLHRRGVGAITLHPGIHLEGLQATLAWLAHESLATGSSSEMSEVAPSVPGISVGRVAYDRLILGDDAEAGRHEVAALWRALAAAAFETELEADHGSRNRSSGGGRLEGDGNNAGGPERGASEEPSDAEPDAAPEAIAEVIERRVQHEPYARRVAFVLLTLTTQVSSAPPSVREELAARLRSVLQRLSDSSLSSIVRAVGTGSEQRRFLSSIISALPVSAVIEWLEVSARVTDQALSHHLLRILAKLSTHAGNAHAGASAQLSVRDAARDLVSGWQLDDPNPIEHAQLLDHIALFDATADAGGCEGASASISDLPRESARLVQMACEIDAAGDDAVAAAETLVAAGHAVLLFEWLHQAPGTNAADRLRAAVRSSSSVTEALLREPFDAAAARALLASTALSSAPALLLALEKSASRAARRMVFDRLREFGPALAPMIRQHLDAAPPWYFARNLLALLRDVTSEVGDTSASGLSQFLPFLDHAHEQVRIEALRLLLEDRATREQALRRALDDSSPRIVAAAVAGAAALTVDGGSRGRNVFSRDVAARLLHLAESSAHDGEVQARAVRALAGAPGPTVRDWLIAHVTRRTRVLRRVILADARPTVIAALQVLAHGYSSDPRVTPVLALAREQSDARRDAVQRTDAETAAEPAAEPAAHSEAAPLGARVMQETR